MNSLLHFFASPSWTFLIKALLHTLWIGALVALPLVICLRRSSNPFLRYRLCLATLLAILFGGLITWAALNQKPSPRLAIAAASVTTEKQIHASPVAIPSSISADAPSINTAPQKSRTIINWIPWLALLWLSGASLMLLRAAAQVARAESFRRSTQPLNDPSVLTLVEQARAQLRIVRRIRIVVSEKLTSPAVMGVIVPTLILPLSLLTSLPANQLQLIILHELAHVRRDDYLANLCQLIIEAVLFFNPAVWWISRQMRLEREACCDALAIHLAPDRTAYARALAQVAEQNLLALSPSLAFADNQNPSSLKDRIQRLLIPGHRPSMRFTWSTLLTSLLLGSTLLIVSALGTQWTVHAATKLLTPQERIARIEQKLQDLGQPLTGSVDDDTEIPVKAIIKTKDGSPLPPRNFAQFHLSSNRHNWGAHVSPNKMGLCTYSLPRGDLFFAAGAEGYAPGIIGPINTRSSNRVEGLELILDRGFPVTFHLTDADSGAPIPQAVIETRFYFPGRRSNINNSTQLTTDAQGNALLEHCSPLLLEARVQGVGYETIQKQFDGLTNNQVLELTTRKALPVAGTILAKTSSRPLPNATVYVLRSEGVQSVSGVYPISPSSPLATTDAQGRFEITQLPRQGRYELLVQADGFTQAIILNVLPGQTNLQASLAPAVILHGKVTGDLSKLLRADGKRLLDYSVSYTIHGQKSSYGEDLKLDVRDGIGYFELTNNFAGEIVFSPGLKVEMKPRDATHTDVTIALEAPATPNPQKMRSVIVKFTGSNNVQPKGTVFIGLPQSTPHTLSQKEITIQNGEVRFDALVDREFSIDPAHMVGFWFDRIWQVHVDDLSGPLVTNINLIPAGAIYAQARNPDDSFASDVFFSVKEVKRSPLATPGAPAVPDGDSYSGDSGPRKFVATPLPLGGTYQIIAWRKNNFAVSEIIPLTEEKPDARVELKLQKGVTLTGQVLSASGQPLAGAQVSCSFNYNGSGFGSEPFYADENGRFTTEDCNPNFGEYSLNVRSPGMKSQTAKVNFKKLPTIIKLEPGLKLSGRFIDIASKRPLVKAEVRALDKTGKHPGLTTRTDDQGNFTFDEMADATYYVNVEGGYTPGLSELKPGPKPITIEVNLTQGIQPQLGALAQ